MSDKDWKDGYDRYLKEKREYLRNIASFGYDNLPHEFNDNTCAKCGEYYTSVINGTGSWVCKGEKKDNWSGHNAYYATPVQQPETPKKCSCDIRVLMARGCKCGGS